MSIAPVFFLSHGAPTFASEPGEAGRRLKALGKNLSDIAAVLVVSPHWQTAEVEVMAAASPATLHDFHGFPRPLYELRYPAPGHPAYAAEAGRLLAEAAFTVGFDGRRGFDHGAWVPLLHLLPAANVPVFQVSMPRLLDPVGALKMGQALAPLREKGVTIIGSGALTHNLHDLRRPDAGEEIYVREFAAWVGDAVASGAVDRLVAYRRAAPHAERAHPTEEHFLPLLVALGAKAGEEPGRLIEGGTTYGVLAMDSFVWGMEG